MSKRIRLTEARVRDCELGEYADEVEAGLMLYVTPTSRRWGLYKWSPSERRPVRKSIGPWPLISVDDARKRAKALAVKLLDGESLVRPDKLTLGDLTDRYEKWNRTRGLRKPAWVSDLVELSFGDWKQREVSSITKADLAARHEHVAATRGVAAATRVIKALRALYTYAGDQGLYEGANTARAVAITDGKPRRRYLTPVEFARVRAVLNAADPDGWRGAYFTLLLLTGARLSNAASMRWDALDLDGARWRIPPADSKTGEPLEVMLVPEAVALLRDRRERVKGEWVFPARRKGTQTGHLVEPGFAWKDVLAEAKVPLDVTIHDCRRTLGVRLTASGAPITVVAKILGHANPATTARAYAWASEESARGWLEKL